MKLAILFVLNCVCIYVCVYMCVCVWCLHVYRLLCVYVKVRDQCLVSSSNTPTLFFDAESITEPGTCCLCKTSQLVTSRDPPVSAFPDLQLKMLTTASGSYESNSDSHACTMSTVPTAISPSPYFKTFNLTFAFAKTTYCLV